MNFKCIFILVVTGVFTGCQSKSSPPAKDLINHSVRPDSLAISHAWIRPAAAGQNSAAYLHIFNGTSQTDTLSDIQADFATRANVHESYEENGMRGMRPARAPTIAPDSTLYLEPGGLHIMLMNLNRSLAAGDSVSVQLEFSESGKKNIRLPVKLSGMD